MAHVDEPEVMGTFVNAIKPLKCEVGTVCTPHKAGRIHTKKEMRRRWLRLVS